MTIKSFLPMAALCVLASCCNSSKQEKAGALQLLYWFEVLVHIFFMRYSLDTYAPIF